ncbi:4-diphosphocytidyl-2-C-methyl-D-erythritol kinase [Filimonas sp.]|nr:4-diphosphocytidyl-2-C-methyl-D-erythritol kinase [Filimonas sp.]
MRGIFICSTFTPMLRFPNCKINLGLSVTHKREDGYHALDTVFYPLPLCDVLEFIESDEMIFESSGLDIPGDANDNIILRAYRLLKHDFPSIPNLHIHLHKNIPTGGGLGGGSSDAAFMLMMMDECFNLSHSPSSATLLPLTPYALSLGSDCPFFLYNTPCHALGRGELLTPINVDLSAYCFVLILPSIHIPTPWAFTQLTPAPPPKSTKDIIRRPIETWKDILKNDFEEGIFKAYPLLKKIKEDLYHAGAVYASMSGSGSTMFGIIDKIRLEDVKKKIDEEKLFEGLGVYYVQG